MTVGYVLLYLDSWKGKQKITVKAKMYGLNGLHDFEILEYIFLFVVFFHCIKPLRICSDVCVVRQKKS